MRSTKINIAIILTLLFVASSAVAASNRSRSTNTKKSKTRRIYWNPVLRGSHDSMLRQNEEIDRLQLPRIEDDAQLEELISKSELVAIEDVEGLHVSPQLDANRRYCRPWTLGFLQDFGSAFYEKFKKDIQVNSAVRTVEQQKKLRRRNKNAAPEEGEIASSHLAGITVDISKRELTRTQRKWINAYLLELRNANVIEAAEERRQAVYHIMVSERYTAFRDDQLMSKK